MNGDASSSSHDRAARCVLFLKRYGKTNRVIIDSESSIPALLSDKATTIEDTSGVWHLFT